MKQVSQKQAEEVSRKDTFLRHLRQLETPLANGAWKENSEFSDFSERKCPPGSLESPACKVSGARCKSGRGRENQIVV